MAHTQAQELIDKSPQMPDDVVWHFIGHLQSNKAKALVAGVPHLAVLETLDTTKLANKLQVDARLGRALCLVADLMYGALLVREYTCTWYINCWNELSAAHALEILRKKIPTNLLAVP